MKTKLSCALGVALLAASFTFGGALACSEALETTPSALQTAAPDSEANFSERLDELSCTFYSSGGETCIAIDALPNSQASEADHASVISEIEPVTDAPLTGDAIVVEITQTVTIVVPGQIVEDNEGPTYTGSILEPSVILDPQTTALDDPD